MTRTDAYDEHLRQIEQLRTDVIACRTMIRAYADYAELVNNTTFGALGDVARGDVAAYARNKSAEWAKKAKQMTDRADQLERDGVPS